MAPSAAPTGPALREAKRAMRTAVVALRDALPPDARAAASQAIATRVMALPEFASASSILVTLPFRSEWDSALVARAALSLGKRVIVPRVDVSARMLTLHVLDSLDRDIEPGYRGIPEPRADTPRVVPDEVTVALVPGVAFDAAGRRLGYGGGYYDRLLPLIAREVPRIAGAFDLQVVDHVPAAPHDHPIHVIVTPTRTVGPRASA
jgi:5-formyltetrahydrofolate cyclo-ligase